MPVIVTSTIGLAIVVILIITTIVLFRKIRALELDLQGESDACQNIDSLRKQYESQYHALLEGINEGVVIVDSEHRIKMVNQNMCDIFRTDPKGILDHQCFEHLCGSKTPCENCPGMLSIASGKPTMSTLEMFRVDGSKLVARIHSSPIRDKSGEMALFMLVVEDITSIQTKEHLLKQNENRYRTLFRELGEGFLYIKSTNPSNERAATQFQILDVNPAMEELLGISRDDLIDKNITELPLGKMHEFMEHLRAVDTLGKPVQNETYHPELQKYFSYRIFSPSSNRIAIIFRETTEHRLAEQKLAEAYEREIEFGTRIQQTMLQGRIPRHIPGADIAVQTVPSYKIDGDFHDFIHYDSKHFDIIIGDVMGKGGSAALLGAATKLEFVRDIGALLSASGNTELATPEEIVNKVQGSICAGLMELNSFVSACYVRFNLDKKRLDYVDCGHTGIAHYKSRTNEFHLLRGENMPLGFTDTEVYSQHSVIFDNNDVFIFYSDGLIQAADASEKIFGEDRLGHHIAINAQLPSDVICQKLIEAVKTFTNKPSQLDDLTCIAVKINAEKQDNVLLRRETSFMQHLTDLVGLRNFIRSACQDSPLTLDEEFVSRLELAVNEAASSIILNSGESDAQITAVFSLYDSQTVIDIIHSGQLFTGTDNTSPALDGTDESGFGLFLIRNCVDKIEYDRSEDGRSRVKLIKYIA